MSEASDMLGGVWPFTWVCRWKGTHVWLPWRRTYQPHVQVKECRRCQAEQYRTIPW